jgi:hypothetical protein
LSHYDLRHLIDGFTLFPDPASVFAQEVSLHAQCLLPLASIDLTVIDAALTGTVHFITPIEPHDGVVGEDADEYFTYLTRENFVGYKYAGNRCVLDGDFNYFEHRRLSVLELSPKQTRVKKLLDDHYFAVRLGHERARKHALQYGMLHVQDAGPPFGQDDQLQIALRLGGNATAGNWCSSPEAFPIDYGRTERDDGGFDFDVAPLTADGRRFVFVGDVPVATYNWNDTCALCCNLLLFYDPHTQTALTTFDWS